MKTLKFFFAAIAALMTMACAQEEIDVLTMGSTEINVSYKGAEQTLSFTTSAAWKIEADKDWVSFDVEEGQAGDVEVVMTVAANTGYENREAVVTITAGDKFTEYVIKQGFATEFEAGTEYNYDFLPHILEVALNTNAAYEVTLSEGAEAWISSDALTKAAPKAETLTFVIALNAGAERTGEITITAGETVQTIVVNQSAFEGTVMTSVEKASYLGQTSYLYNGSSYNEFDEYYVEFTNAAGDVLTLSINNEMSENPMAALPVGDFFAGSVAHEVGSFTITDGTAKYYTSATLNGTPLSILDGSVTISVEEKTYKVLADLTDEAGVSYGFVYYGEMPELEDKSFNATIEASAYGQYDTYFSTKANKFNVTMYISAKNPTSATFLRYLSVNFYAGEDAVSTELPVGTYTIAQLENDPNIAYNNGKLLAAPGAMSGYSANDNEFTTIRPLDGSTMTITKNTDGTYNFALNLQISLVTYDENWNEVVGEPVAYETEFTNIEIGEVPFAGQMPAPDADAEFKSIMMGGLQGYSFGDKFETGGNFFFLQNTYINGTYTMNLMLNQSGAYEVNNQPRAGYSSVPIEDGTYTYSATPTAGERQILKAKYLTYTNTIQNTYTGTTYTITSGTVTYQSGSMTVNLVATDANGNEYKFTGTYADPFQQVRDYSTNATQLGRVSLITE